ncbi:MAG TPA: hypothetical protein VGT78_05065 [Rhizomicrobium sp.]|nr:hypothetical protein [Rhizomicrobium sp.]
MVKLKFIGGAALVCSVLAFNVASASAAETANLTGCIDQGKQVKTALDANQQSANYSDAVKQQRYGLEFCNSGLYQKGVDHYAQALKLLDPAKS